MHRLCIRPRIVVAVAFLARVCQEETSLSDFIRYTHMLLPLSGLLAGVKPRVKLLALAILYSGNPKVRYDTVLALALLT